jgi:hypothetical protein
MVSSDVVLMKISEMIQTFIVLDKLIAHVHAKQKKALQDSRTMRMKIG